MAADWYCEIDGEEQGPITAGQLRQLAVNGELRPTHLIWKEGMPKKVPARSVKGLFDGNGDTAAASPSKRGAAKGPAGSRPQPKKAAKTIVAEDIVEMVDAQIVEDEDEVIENVEVVEEDAPAMKKRPEQAKPRPKKPVVDEGAKTSVNIPPPRPGANRSAPAAKGGAAAGQPSPRKPFRITIAGKPLGPCTLEDIRRHLASGEVKAADMIGFEVWLPAAVLRFMLQVGAGMATVPASTAAAAAMAAKAEENVEVEDLEEIEIHEVDDDDDAKHPAPAAVDDEGKIPMDMEFKLE